MASKWTKEQLDILTTYLKQGLSCRQIANKMNITYSSIEKTISRYDLAKFRVQSAIAKKFVENIELEELNDLDFAKAKEDAKLKWVIKPTKLPANKKKEYETAFVLGDFHIPHHDASSIKAVLECITDNKPDQMVINGDYLDYGCVSHWNQNRRKTLEMARLKNDYIIGNSLLDEIDSRLPKGCKKNFLKGNHEVWIDDLLEAMPQLQGLIEPEELLKLEERGYKVTPYNDFVQVGKLNITHGIFAGGNPVKKHLDELKVNILFGHTHTIGMMLSSSIAREVAFSGYNSGCLCNMAPDYMKGRPHGWSHGFAIVHTYPNGYFEVNLIRIIDGKFIYNNKIYNGNK